MKRLRYQLAWLLAWIWTQLWGWSRWLRIYLKWKFRRNLRIEITRSWAFYSAFAWGRRESPEPISCASCLWKGPRRWAAHAYRDDSSGEDVEPNDECPLCGDEV